jgi:protein-S-isoprenylcysteine O-methyltransferase Ste14
VAQQEAAQSEQTMFLRALFAFLLLPGTFAGLVPFLIVSNDSTRKEAAASLLGAIPLVIGIGALGWCVRNFYVSGKGTLAPWDPPKRLVRDGLYRFARNPMYIGVLLLTTGWGIVTGSPLLLAYTAILAVAFHLRVLLFEEPWLEKQFGEEWIAYTAAVPRWMPRLRPRRGQH